MTMRERLERMPVASPIWAQRYPELLTLWEEEAAAPKGNIIRRNLCQGGVWDGLREDARSYVELSANLVADDVGLEGTAPRFGLRADSLAHSIGFQLIPLEQVGPRDPSTPVSYTHLTLPTKA